MSRSRSRHAELTKSWAAFNVAVTPSAVNLIRQPHDFTITVTQDLGAGPEPVERRHDRRLRSGAAMASLSPAASCITAGGECTVTVTSDAPGAGTLTVVGLRDVPISDGVTTMIIPSVTVDASGALTVPATGGKAVGADRRRHHSRRGQPGR